MPVNPLVSYADEVSSPATGTNSGDPAFDAIETSQVDPLAVQPLSPEAWAQMSPDDQWNHVADIVAPGDDEDPDNQPGSFNPDVELDPSQVENRLPGSAVPTEMTPPPGPPQGKVTNPIHQAQAAIEHAASAFSHWFVNPDNTPKDTLAYRWSELAKAYGTHLRDAVTPGKSDAARQHLEHVLHGPNGEPADLTVPGDKLQAEHIVGLQPGTDELPHVEAAGTPQSFVAQPQSQSRPKATAAPKAPYDPAPEKWTAVSDDPHKVAPILNVARSMVNGSRPSENLVHAAYAAAGIDVSDIPDFQIQDADPVGLKDLKPGDLVNWKGDEEYGKYETRVGVYLDGGKVIEKQVGQRRASVRDLTSLKEQDVHGYRITAPKSNVSLDPNEADLRFRKAIDLVEKAVKDSFKDISKKDSSSTKRGGGSSGGSSSSGSSSSGRTDINKGSSWEPRSDGGSKYSGIGATK